MIFAILGIEETKEEEQIRQAYRIKLLENNPEDHPEGFQRLREAYEQALSYAKMPEEDKIVKEDLTPVGRWMEQVKEVYYNLPKRLSKDAWKALFRDEICMDLDYGEEAKWKLFEFLAEHYRLPSAIYRLLDEFFEIQKGEKEFKEHFSTAFVDYILRRIRDVKGEEDFPYQWIEGADTADYDQFYNRLYELEEWIDEEKIEEAKQTVEVMEQLKIDHPYYRAAKARLAILQGRKDVGEVAKELLETYQESVRIQLLGIDILWNCDRKEEAITVCRQFYEKFGAAYLSEKYLTIYEKEKGNFADAIRHCQQALQRTNDSELEEVLEELDTAYIAVCTEELEKGTLSPEDMRYVCSSYIRTERVQEGLDLLFQYPNYKEAIRNIHNVLSALYFHADRYQESIQECKLWRNDVEKRIAEKVEEEEKDEIYSELIMTYSCEGRSLQGIAETLTGRDAVMASYKEAEQAFLQAIFYDKNFGDKDKNLRIKQELLDLLLLEGEFERAIELADEILAQDRKWFPALVQKQQACYELDRPQEVVDLFEEAKGLYTGYAPMYELTAKVFIDYEQYENAEEIFQQAKEEKLESFGLELAKLYLERVQCESKDSFDKLLKQAKKLLKRFEKERASKRELAELYYEMAILEDCRSEDCFGYLGKAEKYINKAIRLRINEPLKVIIYYYYTYARISQNKGDYKGAIKNYEIYRQHAGITERLAFNMAECYYEIEEWEKAIQLYQEVLLLNPKQQEANRKIASIYRWIGFDKNSVAMLKKAKFYAEQQLFICPDNAYDYRAKGNICRLLGELDQAMEDAEKSLELEQDNSYGLFLKGRVLYYTGNYKTALDCLERAIQNLRNVEQYGHDMLSFAARCCRRLGDYVEAEKWYQKGIALFEGEDQEDCYWKLIGLYEEQKRLEEAFLLLNEAYQKNLITEEEYVNDSIDIRRGLCYDKEQAKQLEQEAYQAAQKFDSIDAWETLADLQFFYLDDTKKALETKKLVMERVEQEQVQWEHNKKYLERMQIYWEAKDTKEVEKWAERYIQVIEDHYPILQEEFPPIEQHLNDPQSGYHHLCRMIRYWIFTGQMELAKQELEKIKKMTRCRHCWEQECTDLIESWALYYEAVGELEKAYRCWYKNWKNDSNDEMYYYKVRTLGEKLGYTIEWKKEDRELWNRLNKMKI